MGKVNEKSIYCARTGSKIDAVDAFGSEFRVIVFFEIHGDGAAPGAQGRNVGLAGC